MSNGSIKSKTGMNSFHKMSIRKVRIFSRINFKQHLTPINLYLKVNTKNKKVILHLTVEIGIYSKQKGKDIQIGPKYYVPPKETNYLLKNMKDQGRREINAKK